MAKGLSTFDAAAFNSTQYHYNWQPGPDTSVITFAQGGQYNLLVKDEFGCYAKKTMQVELAMPTDASFVSAQADSTSTWFFMPNDLSADTYLWDFGDGTTSMEQNPQHHYVGLGAYVVSLTTSDLIGCPAQTTQDTLQFLFSGTLDQPGFTGRVYPNPFRSEIQIDFTDPMTAGFTISLENEIGHQLSLGKYPVGTERCRIGTEALPAGVYWLRITQEDKVWTLKMLRL